MLYNKVEAILRHFKLSNTVSRRAVLEFFLTTNQAYSHKEVVEALADKYDRVTVYRSLLLFAENGILHKVLDDSNSMKYALTNIEGHETAHLHFKCEVCNKVECLHTMSFPAVRLPDGYKLDSTYYLAQGVCNTCGLAKQ